MPADPVAQALTAIADEELSALRETRDKLLTRLSAQPSAPALVELTVKEGTPTWHPKCNARKS